MSEQENARFMQQAYDKFNAGDIEGMLSMLADDVDWVLPTVPGMPFMGQRKGRDNVRAFFATLSDVQEPKSFDVHGMIAQGDQVVAYGHYVWRVKSTGREIEADFAHIWTVSGGKITRIQEYTDTAAAAAGHAS